MTTTTNDDVQPQDVAAMQRELRSLRKTCEVLKAKVEQDMKESGSSFASFERQAHLQRVIEEHTSRLRDEATRSQQENRERARIEALLTDSQRLARVGSWMFDLSDESMQCTSELCRILEIEEGSVARLEQLLPFFDESFRGEVEVALCDAIGNQSPFDLEGRACTGASNDIWVRVQGRVYTEDGRASRILGLISDVTERKQVESTMAQSQKMESVGQLASGIAHEINTPTQFVSDNVRFLQTAFEDLGEALSAIRDAAAADPEAAEKVDVKSCIDEALAAADYEFLSEEVPGAISQALEGLDRVANLVKAMKDYAHPGSESKEYSNLNRAIESTATVARNEWKYVANLEFDLDAELPEVPCFVADLNQVVLNMIVNAAHAIAERYGNDSEPQGVIRLATRQQDGFAVITIQDDGNGIPEHVRNRIFDPFFTTKEVGRGTGQGLAISHQVIVERHAGKIEVESETGVGTRMELWLPLTEEQA
ncbi:MAG: hypothetical protein KAI24_23965 [Planctomycetes bacterium]|nr:hypothetical protein [Planctomycetota bacterium]